MKIFCAQCGSEKEFDLVVDANGEVVSTDDQKHFLKFPAPANAGELKKWIEQHNGENHARVMQALATNAQKKKTEAILGQLK